MQNANDATSQPASDCVPQPNSRLRWQAQVCGRIEPSCAPLLLLLQGAVVGGQLGVAGLDPLHAAFIR